jgi:hypothetical protein
MDFEDKKYSIFDGVGSGESQLLRVVRDATADGEPIVNVQLQNLRDEPIKELPLPPAFHNVLDGDSFTSWVEKYCDETTSVIFWQEKDLTVRVVVDPMAKKAFPRNTHDDFGALQNCVYQLSAHRYFKEWQTVMASGLRMSHERMLKFLMQHKNDVDDAAELIQGWKEIETAVNMKHNAKYDNGYRMTVEFASETGNKKSTELVREFKIQIPVLNSDDDSFEFVIEIDVYEPRTTGEEATFEFRSRAFDDALLTAMDREVSHLKESLPAFPFMHGWCELED